jgi:hypothetical protein
MGTQREHMKGVLPWLVRWALYAGTRDFYPDLAALVDPVKKYIFLAVNYVFQLIFEFSQIFFYKKGNFSTRISRNEHMHK